MSFDTITGMTPGAGSRRFYSVIVVLILVLLVLIGIDWLYPRYISSHWQSISAAEEQRSQNDVQSRFTTFQQETIRLVEQIEGLQGIHEVLANSDNSSIVQLFGILKQMSREDLSLEVFDHDKHLLSWAGSRGPFVDSMAFTSVHNSFVSQGPIYSYLIVVVPDSVDGRILGYVVGKRLFKVNYPLNNRFVNSAAFATTFSKSFETLPDFDFSAEAKPQQDARTLSIVLRDIHDTPVGFAYLSRPVLTDRIDEIHRQIRNVASLIIIVLVALLVYKGTRWVRIIKNTFVRIMMFSVCIWLVRYSFVVMNFPASFLHESIFDPAYFASPFGFGLVKTIGDMLISSLFLLVNIGVVAITIFRQLNSSEGARVSISLAKRFIYATSGIVLLLLIFLMLRGFASTVRSAVFDSTLVYNDPTSVMPSFELSAMLVGIFSISCGVVLAGVATLHVWYRFISIALGFTRATITIPAAIIQLSIFSLSFGALQQNPLISQTYRLFLVLLLFVFMLWLVRQFQKRSKLYTFGGCAFISCIAIAAAVPQLDGYLHDFDRTHVELVAADIVRPVDTWLRFVVNKALDELSSGDANNTVVSGDQNDLEKLAFTEWAKSILSKEGYNCSVSIVNKEGKIVSDFHIGMPLGRRPHTEIPAAVRFINMEEKMLASPTTVLYTGYTPLLSESAEVVGGIWLELSAGRRAILRGGTPEVLRNYSRENFDARFRKLIISEYFQGKLVYTSAEDLPLERELPRGVLEITGAATGKWIDDVVGNKKYETYYVKEGGKAADSWIALSMESLGFQWHFFSYLRYVLFYVLLAGAVTMVVIVLRLWQGKRIFAGFNRKLIVAFITVSLMPVVILAYYNNQYAVERAEETTATRLSQQTSVVVSELEKEMGVSVPVSLSRLTDSQCEDLAASLDLDFNVYFSTILQASSKPEIFTAELLDENLSSDAYVNIMLQKKNFFVENQSVGSLPYVVGYRPLAADDGRIIGIVSVPTLFRQVDINEDAAKRNIFLFGAYMVAIFFSVIVGTIFANQIASPIRKLKEATQRIASGKLDIRFSSDRGDEIGDLERSFSRMTKDLKEAQDKMLSAERELAWREMAKQVAHEIKNPLTPMKLSIQHLRQAYHDNVNNFGSLLDRVSETILNQIDGLSRIASEFSHLARMPERKLELCDIHETLHEAASLFQQQQELKFLFELRSRLFTIMADREELRRAFINIFRNAAQAMNDRGTISIITSLENDVMEIRMSDTGPGIPDEVKKHLFEPNFSTKKDGMGLGLTIVKNTITTLGGEITIESRSVPGTMVIVRLPIHKPQ